MDLDRYDRYRGYVVPGDAIRWHKITSWTAGFFWLFAFIFGLLVLGGLFEREFVAVVFSFIIALVLGTVAIVIEDRSEISKDDIGMHHFSKSIALAEDGDLESASDELKKCVKKHPEINSDLKSLVYQYDNSEKTHHKGEITHIFDLIVEDFESESDFNSKEERYPVLNELVERKSEVFETANSGSEDRDEKEIDTDQNVESSIDTENQGQPSSEIFWGSYTVIIILGVGTAVLTQPEYGLILLTALVTGLQLYDRRSERRSL